jgi:lipopolysaccharide transport system permease protein
LAAVSLDQGDMPTVPALNLALHFIRREVRSRYLGSLSGGLWALAQPLIQLAVFGVVYVYVFKAPPPAGDIGVLPFLALGLWPWNAFAEALVRSTNAIPENAALIGKVALPREVLVLAAASSSFLLHGVGFCAICIALWLWGAPIHLQALPLAAAVYLQFFVFALGLALILSAVQVFVRDLAQVLTQLLQIWMFASPVWYPREFLPERYRDWMSFNPIAYYIESFRSILVGSGQVTLATQAVALIVAVAVLLAGFSLFRRLSPHFEDFL